jgi:threonine dehydratase
VIELQHIKEAAERIAKHIRHTPVVRCAELDELLSAELFFKCENLQAAGAFKTRGACNAVFSLSDDEASCGVATHSSGNHAAALARAAARRGVPAYIVMPRTSRPKKIGAVHEFGGQITFCEPTLDAREATAERIVAETGATLIHPYDDDRIIAGQGTAALEMLQRHGNLDIVITPVGGGGLLSGTAICAKALRPEIQVWAGEPAGADDAYRSWKAGELLPSIAPQTIADGLLTSLGIRNFAVIRKWVDDILLVGENEIIRAVRLLYDQLDLVVEPSGAVPVAALAARTADIRGKRVGVILSGGNFDLSDLTVL